jgi:hypothetical protein
MAAGGPVKPTAHMADAATRRRLLAAFTLDNSGIRLLVTLDNSDNADCFALYNDDSHA